jgi:hypothetical protein
MTMAFILIILIPLAVLAALLVVRDRRQRRRHAGDADMVDAAMESQVRAASADAELKRNLFGSSGAGGGGMLTRSPCAWPLDANYRRAPARLVPSLRMAHADVGLMRAIVGVGCGTPLLYSSSSWCSSSPRSI